MAPSRRKSLGLRAEYRTTFSPRLPGHWALGLGSGPGQRFGLSKQCWAAWCGHAKDDLASQPSQSYKGLGRRHVGYTSEPENSQLTNVWLKSRIKLAVR
jgi:hypothetical protein